MSDLDPRHPKGWHSRGYLPHFDGGEIAQSLTFRLADSVPTETIAFWRRQLANTPEQVARTKLRRRMDKYADSYHGACLLNRSETARIVADSLCHFDGDRHALHAWVVMPNHVHALVTPNDAWPVEQLIHSWKSFTAHEINDALGRAGRLWAADYFDRYIRDEAHFERAVAYIEHNPVKAGLCRSPCDRPWSSAGQEGLVERQDANVGRTN